MFARVGAFIVAVVRFVLPWCRETKSEKLGTWLTGIAVLLMGIGYALPLLQGDDPGQPPAIELPAPGVQPEDVPACVDCVPFLPVPDVPVQEDSGPLAFVAGFLFPFGCSAAQQQVWKDAATKLGQCLASLGVQHADDLVTSWMGGEAVDAAQIGWELLPGFLDCAMKFGVVVYSGLSQPPGVGDSVGATMTPQARMLSAALSDSFDPLTAQCGTRDAPPTCTIVLYAR